MVIPEENRRLLEKFAAKEGQKIVELTATHLVKADRLAELLNTSPQAISDAEKEFRIFSLGDANGNKLYPAFYRSASVDLKVFETVSKHLGSLPGASKWQFFTTPKYSLGRKTPIKALEAGQIRSVLAAAASFKES